MDAWILNQNKTELHRHLEGALPVSKLWDLVQSEKIDLPYKSLQQIKDDVQILKPLSDLSAVLKAFTVVQKFFKTTDLVYELTWAALEQALSEGITQLEFRFSPEYMASQYNLDWDQMMQVLVLAKSDFMKAHPHFKVGYIAIVSRFYGLLSAKNTADFAANWKSDLVGFDFADDEVKFPSKDFLPIANQVHDIGLPLTVHTGEGTPSSFIQEVIQTYHPKRLGHATTLIEDLNLVELCVEKNICVECCPTSNKITKVVPDPKNHPIKALFEKGVAVTLNTDDPTPFVCTLNSEWQLAQDVIGLSKGQILQINDNASQHSFLN